MEILLIILMSLSVTGVSIWAISNKSEKNRVFKYTSFEDEQKVQHVFLVYSPDFTLAQKDAMKMITLNDLQIQKVEELDSKTWDVIGTPYYRSERSKVKVEKLK